MQAQRYRHERLPTIGRTADTLSKSSKYVGFGRSGYFKVEEAWRVIKAVASMKTREITHTFFDTALTYYLPTKHLME